jgi:hypothetical protein
MDVGSEAHLGPALCRRRGGRRRLLLRGLGWTPPMDVELSSSLSESQVAAAANSRYPQPESAFPLIS